MLWSSLGGSACSRSNRPPGRQKNRIDVKEALPANRLSVCQANNTNLAVRIIKCAGGITRDSAVVAYKGAIAMAFRKEAYAIARPILTWKGWGGISCQECRI